MQLVWNAFVFNLYKSEFVRLSCNIDQCDNSFNLITYVLSNVYIDMLVTIIDFNCKISSLS